MAITRNGCGSGYEWTSTVTWPSFIASSSADCVLGVVRLISSASRMLVNIGPRLNSNCCSMRRVHRDAQHVGGQHVAGELHALKAAIESAGQGLSERGLADPGDAFNQQVSAGENGNQRQADDVVLAANDFAQRVFELRRRDAKRQWRFPGTFDWILLCGHRIRDRVTNVTAGF